MEGIIGPTESSHEGVGLVNPKRRGGYRRFVTIIEKAPDVCEEEKEEVSHGVPPARKRQAARGRMGFHNRVF